MKVSLSVAAISLIFVLSSSANAQVRPGAKKYLGKEPTKDAEASQSTRDPINILSSKMKRKVDRKALYEFWDAYPLYDKGHEGASPIGSGEFDPLTNKKGRRNLNLPDSEGFLGVASDAFDMSRNKSIGVGNSKYDQLVLGIELNAPDVKRYKNDNSFILDRESGASYSLSQEGWVSYNGINRIYREFTPKSNDKLMPYSEEHFHSILTVYGNEVFSLLHPVNKSTMPITSSNKEDVSGNGSITIMNLCAVNPQSEEAAFARIWLAKEDDESPDNVLKFILFKTGKCI